MARIALGCLLLLLGGSGAAAKPSATDFVVLALSQLPERIVATNGETRASPGMSSAVRLAASWGTVTSVLRSAAHNRAVGGAPNSYHLSGLAIDVARRRGVSHAQIDLALRRAGHVLVESLDEGDHSHFAFGRQAVSLPQRLEVAIAPPQLGPVHAPPAAEPVGHLLLDDQDQGAPASAM